MKIKEKIIITILLNIVEFIGKDVDGFYSHKYIDSIRELLKEKQQEAENG